MNLRAIEGCRKQKASRGRTTRARVGREESRRQGSSNGKVGYHRGENERRKLNRVREGALGLEVPPWIKMGDPDCTEREEGRREDAHFSSKVTEEFLTV